MALKGFEILPKEYRSPIWVLVLGLVLSTLTFIYSNNWKESFAESQFKESAQFFSKALQENLDSHLNQLNDLETIYAANNNIDRGEFKKIVEEKLAKNPGTESIQWLQKVSKKDLKQFIAETRHYDIKNYKISSIDSNFQRIPLIDKEYYFPIHFSEPSKNSNSLLGIDPTTPELMSVLEKQYHLERQFVITKPIQLKQNSTNGIYFEAYLAAYRYLKTRTTGHNSKVLSGLIRAEFNIKEIINHTADELETQADGIKIFLFNEPLKSTNDKPILIRPISPSGSYENHSNVLQGINLSQHLHFGNERWKIIYKPVEIDFFSKNAELLPWVILFGGYLLTVFLVGHLIIIIKKTRQEIKSQIEPTKLINSQDLIEQEETTNAIWAIDKNGNTTFANQQMANILGFSSIEDIIGEHVYNFLDEEGKKISLQNLSNHKNNIHEDYEVDLISSTNSKVPVRMSVTPFFDENGRYDGALANVTINNLKHLSENEIRIHETRLRALTENINDITIIIDNNSGITYVSPSVEKITGFSSKELLGGNLYNLLHNKDKVILGNVIDDISEETGKRVNIKEFRIKNCDDNYVFFSGNITNMSDVSGVNGIILNGRNITDRKYISKLKDAQQKVFEKLAEDNPLDQSLSLLLKEFEEIIPGAHASIYLVSSDSSTINCLCAPSLPEEFCQSMGNIPIAESSGCSAGCAYHKQFQYAEDISLLPHRTQWREIVYKAGMRSCWAHPIISTSNEVLGAFSIYFEDPQKPDTSKIELLQNASNFIGIVLERKQSEEALRESEIHWRSIIAHLPDYVGLLDLDATFIFANKVAPGFAIEEVMGTNLFDYVEEDHKAAFKDTMEKVLETGKPHTYEIPLNTPDGRIWWSNRVGLMKRSGETIGFITIGTDITDRKEIELSLNKLSSAVEQSGSAIIIMNTEGIIEYVNPRFSDISGYSFKEAVDRNIDLFQYDSGNRTDNDEFWKTILAGDSWHGETKNKRKNGEIYWTLISVSPIHDENGHITHFVVVSEDLTKLKETQTEVERLEFYDTLTGLGNRKLFKERLISSLSLFDKSEKKTALLYLDLDQFKRINDTLGHDAGDSLLKSIANRLRKTVSIEDTVARFGGDEFAILLTGINKATDAGQTARKILNSLSEPITVRDQEILITTSIGITVGPDDSADVNTLMKNADLAMYRAKELGRNNYQYYTDEMNIEVLGRLFLENELRQAIEKEQFSLYYQPQIRLKDQSITGIEALIRWNHPQRGIIIPDQFINVAEETGLIVPLGHWIIRTSCEFAKKLHDLQIPPVKVAVNLSVRQFQDPDLPAVIENSLRTSGLPPNYLQLEITESLLMDNIEESISMLKTLKDFGISISIDDFGTGYSSLSYIKRLPIDEIKVDKSFVRDIPEDQNDMEITAAVIAMAHKLNLKVVAEGVETTDQLDFLRRNECDFVQGYLYSRPIESDNVADFIKNNDTKY